MYFAFVARTEQPDSAERDFYACMYLAETRQQAFTLAQTKFALGWDCPPVVEFIYVGSAEKDSLRLYERACLQADAMRKEAGVQKQPDGAKRAAESEQPDTLQRAAGFKQPDINKPVEPVLKHAW